MTYEEVQTLLQMINIDLDEQYALRLFKVIFLTYFSRHLQSHSDHHKCSFLINPNAKTFVAIIVYQYYTNAVIFIPLRNFQL